MQLKDKIDIETLTRILEAMPSAIFFKDTDLKYIFSSYCWDQLDLGEDGEICGKTDRDIHVDKENIEQIEQSDREILETGKGIRYVIESDTDGHVQRLDVHKEPVFDVDGNIIGIVGLINDVTYAVSEFDALLQNEKAYQKAMRAGAFLAYNVNLTADILEEDLMEVIDGVLVNLLDAVQMKAPCSYHKFVNKWVSAMLEADERRGFYEFHAPENLIKRYENGEREVVQELCVTVRTPDGLNPIELWMSETVLLMENINHEIKAFITLRDIGQERLKEKELKKQLEAAVEEAKMANKAKDIFLANTSHEIRTPMNAIVGMAEVLLRDETDSQKIEYLNNIKEAGNHLLEIINDILDISKIESGKMEIVPSVYKLESRLDTLYQLLSERIGDKNIELIFDIDKDLPQYMYGDAKRIRQVIINLVNNAIKFTEEGTVKLTVKVTAISGTKVCEYICVEDTGIGIRDEDKEKLFKAFSRVDLSKNASIEGTGLGLAIAKQIVELMGGNLEFESEYGVGTKFFFTITQDIVTPEEVEKYNEKELLKKFEGGMFKAPKAKVLLAEDSAVNVAVFKALMAPSQIQISVAENGRAAVDMVLKDDYDVVLMDHMMPVMDGIEATGLIRQMDSDKKDIPIIALSANAVVGMKERFLAAGMDDFVSKPIQIKELLIALRRILPEDYIEEL